MNKKINREVKEMIEIKETNPTTIDLLVQEENIIDHTTVSIIPQIIFIVPYRNRLQHKYFFCQYMHTIMEHSAIPYEIYFSHQCDIRTFNRGATKNIGFLAMKEKYPNHYKQITFVFNDIDTVPFYSIFQYETVPGIVKHFYGFKYALGGIVSITGSDFEATNGYPNFWGWGMEDNVLQKRCEKIGLTIDRSHFYPIGSPEILQLFDGVQRIINSKDPWRATHDNGIDGLKTIHNLKYNINITSDNPNDNLYITSYPNTYMINIQTFMTGIRFEQDNYYPYDLRQPPRKIIHPDKLHKNHNQITDDWTHIPYYPTNSEKQQLVKQYGHKQAEEIIEYEYQNKHYNQTPPSISNNQHNISAKPIHPSTMSLLQIKQYNERMRQLGSSERIIPPNINKYSRQYTEIIAPKIRAQIK